MEYVHRQRQVRKDRRYGQVPFRVRAAEWKVGDRQGYLEFRRCARADAVEILAGNVQRKNARGLGYWPGLRARPTARATGPSPWRFWLFSPQRGHPDE